MNKSELKAKGKVILNQFPVGHHFDNNHSEYSFLFRLFQGHPEYSIKAGEGITRISIGIGGEFKTRCFVVHRADGTFTDISYIRSVDGATSKISDIKRACRSAISHLVNEVRAKVLFGVDKCQITGEILTAGNTHIDHYDLTFDDVCNKWLKSENIDLAHSCLNDTNKDNETSIYFTSKFLRDDFIRFHNANTHLRAVSKQANLSTLKMVKK